VSEAVYNAQAAATPTPSEREIVSANNRRAQARLAEARSSQPTLNIGEFECLPDNAGIRVCLTVSTPGRFTVLHNVRVEAGGKILFQYSECWSMSSSKSQWDYFCIPVHLRGTRYKSVTQIWIERQLPGDDRASYKLGRMSEDDHKSCHGHDVSLSQISNLKFWSKLMCLSHSPSHALSLV
jgi:hypothetical protein